MRAPPVLREKLPNVTILAVAHDRLHEIELRKLGPDVIVRETLESSILIAREALLGMGLEPGVVEDSIQGFRKLDRERLLAQVDHGVEAGGPLLRQMYRRRGKPEEAS